MLSRIPQAPPIINALENVSERPLWSVMIPVFNCSQYFPETLRNVLAAGIPENEMQIEVIDDASTDANVEELVWRIGEGRIKYFRQPYNVGSLRNFETCINRARGHYVHLLHGDDRIKPNYYEKIKALFDQFPDAGAAFCSVTSINETGMEILKHPVQMEREGILDNWLIRIAEINRLQYAAITVKRDVYEKLGSFCYVTFGEDWEMWVRIAKNYKVAYTPDYLADYREHSNSITGNLSFNGNSLKSLRTVMNHIQAYLPESKRKLVCQRSRKHYGWSALNKALLTWQKTRNRKIVHQQVKKIAIIYYGDISMYKQIIKLYCKMILNIA